MGLHSDFFYKENPQKIVYETTVIKNSAFIEYDTLVLIHHKESIEAYEMAKSKFPADCKTYQHFTKQECLAFRQGIETNNLVKCFTKVSFTDIRDDPRYLTWRDMFQEGPICELADDHNDLFFVKDEIPKANALFELLEYKPDTERAAKLREIAEVFEDTSNYELAVLLARKEAQLFHRIIKVFYTSRYSGLAVRGRRLWQYYFYEHEKEIGQIF